MARPSSLPAKLAELTGQPEEEGVG
jgi:hypothetical protein